MLVIKTNFNGEFRRFTANQSTDYASLVETLRMMYLDLCLNPPYSHSLKYLDEDGDFVGLISTNDLSLATASAMKLDPPLLRITIDKKTDVAASSSSVQSSTTLPLSSTFLSVGDSQASSTVSQRPIGLKIQGRDIYAPSGTQIELSFF
jgi:hypothetical protein